MGNQSAKVERHVDTCIGTSKWLAIEVDTERAKHFASTPALSKRVRRDEDRRKGARRFRLEEAKALGQFAWNKVTQGHVVCETDEPNSGQCLVAICALNHVAGHDHNLGLHVTAPALVGERDRVAGAEETIRPALVNERIMPEAVGHFCRACLTYQRDMVHIGRTVSPLERPRQRCCRFALVESPHRNSLVRQIGRKRFQQRRDMVPIVERCLKGWRNMGSVRTPREIVRHHNETTITAALQRS